MSGKIRQSITYPPHKEFRPITQPKILGDVRISNVPVKAAFFEPGRKWGFVGP
jgi:hypothetical protein